MSMDMASDNSPFLRLPVEVRLHIYNFALPHSEYHDQLQLLDCPISWHPGTCANILFVNKQVHRDSSEILYQKNYFALYIRHPRNARLVYNETRADPQSFVLISWAHHHWAHPRNPRISWSALQRHSNLQDVRNWYISIPELDDLIGVDAYMRRASIAGLYGINIWQDRCARERGCLADEEKNRMAYVQKYKDPVDEVGKMLQSLPRIDILSLGLGYGTYGITCREYILSEILQRRGVKQAMCFYVNTRKGERVIDHYHSSLERYRQLLQGAHKSFKEESPRLPKGVKEMYWLLRAIRTMQALCPPTDPVDLIKE